MMWRLWHKLFGWDYVRVLSPDEQVYRVWRNGNNRPTIIFSRGGERVGLYMDYTPLTWKLEDE